MCVARELVSERTAFAAASIAFYAFLALLPALLVVMIIYGSIADPRDVQQELGFLARLLPPESVDLLRREMGSLAAQSGESRGVGVALTSLLTLWSSSKGIRAILFALRPEEDPRSALSGRVRRAVLALALAGGAVLVVVIGVAVMMAFPQLLNRLGVPHAATTLIRVFRWPAMATIVFTWLAVLYRHGPGRPPGRAPRVAWGAAFATMVWLAASAGFSLWLARFSDYSKIEGSLAGVLVLLAWFLLAAYSVLFGGQVNKALELVSPRSAGRSRLNDEAPVAGETFGGS